MLGILFRTVVFFAVLLAIFSALGAAGMAEIGLALILAIAGAVGWRWLPTRENKLPLDQ